MAFPDKRKDSSRASTFEKNTCADSRYQGPK